MRYNADMAWDILGHDWAVKMLQQHITGGQMRHAYLFSGPTGVGRRTLALRFAQAVNCVEPPAIGVPCGECRTCRQIGRMQQPDLVVVQSEEEGESLKVDQVRDLQRLLTLAPYESAYRVALLLRFDEATAGAQNALLKTLEEPNEKVLLLLTADDPENLLPTIVSRCELLRLRPMPLDELSGILREKKGLSEDESRLIAHITSGRPGAAFRLAEDEEAKARRKVWLDELLELLREKRTARLQYIHKKTDRRKRAEYKPEFREGLTYWLSFWRDVMLVSTGSSTPLANLDYHSEIESIAGKINQGNASALVARLEHSFARINMANIPVMMDNLLLGWPRL